MLVPEMYLLKESIIYVSKRSCYQNFIWLILRTKNYYLILKHTHQTNVALNCLPVVKISISTELENTFVKILKKILAKNNSNRFFNIGQPGWYGSANG